MKLLQYKEGFIVECALGLENWVAEKQVRDSRRGILVADLINGWYYISVLSSYPSPPSSLALRLAKKATNKCVCERERERERERE